MERKMITSLIILRKCQYCDQEAHNEEELEKFTRAKHYKYGRRNICKPCFAKILRKGGMYHKGHVKSATNWVTQNKQRHTENMKRRITFKGKRVSLKDNPRVGVCADCGALISAKQERQAPMHHEYYDEEYPEDGTTERCDSCHTRFHDAQRREAIKQGKRKGWNEP